MSLDIFIPHFEILPAPQREIWDALSPMKHLGFCLYGGTAIALQLGHRASVDFDFFSEIALDSAMESQMIEALPVLSDSDILQKEVNTRTFRTPCGVKLSFFGGINFGRVGNPLLTEDGVMIVASVEDLLATKLAVILQRVEYKDYKDIAAILESGISLIEGLGAARALYGRQFPPSESVRALTYFHGGDLSLLSEKDKKVLRQAVEKLDIRRLPERLIVSEKLAGNIDCGFSSDKTFAPKM
jgi:hypothetical protein